jgi:hypothetical protein
MGIMHRKNITTPCSRHVLPRRPAHTERPNRPSRGRCRALAGARFQVATPSHTVGQRWACRSADDLTRRGLNRPRWMTVARLHMSDFRPLSPGRRLLQQLLGLAETANCLKKARFRAGLRAGDAGLCKRLHRAISQRNYAVWAKGGKPTSWSTRSIARRARRRGRSRPERCSVWGRSNQGPGIGARRGATMSGFCQVGGLIADPGSRPI